MKWTLSIPHALALGMFFMAAAAGCTNDEPRMVNPVPNSLALPSDAQIRRDPQRSTITELKGRNLSQNLEADQTFRQLQQDGDIGAIAAAFIAAYQDTFATPDPRQTFVVRSVQRDELGSAHVRLDQQFDGLAVFSGELTLHLDSDLHVYLVSGSYWPLPEQLSSIPSIDAAVAANAAAAEVPGMDSACTPCSAQLMIYADDAVAPQLAYEVRVPVNQLNRWRVFVDATSATILAKLPLAYSTGALQ